MTIRASLGCGSGSLCRTPAQLGSIPAVEIDRTIECALKMQVEALRETFYGSP
jgi:predicted RNA methylase